MLKIIILFVLFNISLSNINCELYVCDIYDIPTENKIEGNIGNIGVYQYLNYNFGIFSIGNKVCIKQILKETDMDECPTNNILYCKEKWWKILNKNPIQNENMCNVGEDNLICKEYILNNNY